VCSSDLGDPWTKLSPGDQANEMHTIAQGAQSIGIQNVFVYSQSQPVAESHGDAICVGDCVVQAFTKPSSPTAPTRQNPAAAAQAEATQLKNDKH